MRLTLTAFLIFCIGFSFCTEPISVQDTPLVTIEPIDTTVTQVDSCEERISTLQALNGCPDFVGGLINDSEFFAIADITTHDDIAPNHTAINIRSFRDGGSYAFELSLTLNGIPEENQAYPLTTDGDNLIAWNQVDPDSVYITLSLWLAAADLNPSIFYKSSVSQSNWIRIDSSSYTEYNGEPVTDHFGVLEATLVLNQSEPIQEHVTEYLDRGFCVPDTIFLKNVCFDARTRDVFSSCDRVPGR